MKNVMIIVGLMLSFVCISLLNAQENTGSETTISIKQAAKSDGKNGGQIKVDIEFDDEEIDEEGLKKLTKLVRTFGGEKAVEEMQLEIKGMSAEEKAELLEELNAGFKYTGDIPDIPKGAVAISIIAILSIFVVPVFGLIAILIYSYRRRRQRMEILNSYLQSGKEVPKEVLAKMGVTEASSFRSAVMLIAVGLGIVAAFYASNNDFVGSLGLIPMFVGIAKLVFWYVEEREAK